MSLSSSPYGHSWAALSTQSSSEQLEPLPLGDKRLVCLSVKRLYFLGDKGLKTLYVAGTGLMPAFS